MAIDKKIEIKASLDTSDFINQVNNLQQRLSQIQKQSRQQLSALQIYERVSPQGQITGLARSVFGDVNARTVQQLREIFNLNVRRIRNEQRQIQDKEKELEKIKKTDKEMTVEQQKRVELLKQEIALLKDKTREILVQNATILKQAQALGADLTGFKGVGRTPIGAEGSAVGPAFNLDAMRRYRRLRGLGIPRFLARPFTSLLAGGLGGPLAALGIGGVGALVSGALETTESVLKELIFKRGQLALAAGGAAATQTPFLARAQSANPFELMRQGAFLPERVRALEITSRERARRRITDILSGFTSGGLKEVIGGSFLGASIGGQLGGVMGSLLGLLGGGALGFIGGGFFTNKRAREALLGTEEYFRTITAEQLQRSTQVQQMLEQLNIRKNLAFKAAQQEVPVAQQFERLFGNVGIGRGTVLQSLVTQGLLTSRTGLPILQELMRVSGMTPETAQAGITARNIFTLQQAGLTNAANIFGAIRGLQFGTGGLNTEESMRRLFAEAVRAGVDDSQMVEEMRGFTQTATQIALQRGIRVEEAAAMLSRGVVGRPGAVAFRAARGAMELREREAGFTSPQALAFRLGFLATPQGRRLVEGLTPMQQLVFAGLRESDISAQNPLAQRLARQMGIDLNTEEGMREFLRRQALTQLASRALVGRTRQRILQLGEETQGLTPQQIEEQIAPGGRLFDTIGQIMEELRVQRGAEFNEQDFRTQIAYILGISPQRVATMGREQIGGRRILGELRRRGAETIGARIEEGAARAEEQRLRRLQATEEGTRFIDMFVNNMSRAANASSDLIRVTQDMVKAAGDSTNALEIFARVIRAFASGNEELYQRTLRESETELRKVLEENKSLNLPQGKPATKMSR